MDNELISRKSWWKTNWKWFVPISVIGLGVFAILSSGSSFGDFAQAYADAPLCQDAINEANKNIEVQQNLGKIGPIDKLAILEGNSVYSNQGKTVEMTVRVSAEKGKAKMDISADKAGNAWKYKAIKIRIKNKNREIKVLGK